MNDQLLDFSQVAAAPAAAINGFPYLVLMIIGIVLLFLVIAMIMVVRRFLSRPELHGMSREELRKRWEEIEKIGSGSVMGGKMAIVEADKLLDGALKSMMIPGDTMGERLKFACYRFPELKKVWYAHKLRNQLVHETSTCCRKVE
jgi:hypothetical protein